MFIDEVIMEVTAGRGGDGCMAYRREKFVPMGGPNGGNGGKGANIIFRADEGLKTLFDLRYLKNVQGEAGKNGEGKNKAGSNAEDKIIKVPIGSTIKEFDSGIVIADLTKHNEETIVAHGGEGGKGNVSLATKNNPCPSYAERGEPGETRKIKVELRMLADVGLVGLPSVGKSTLLSKITDATPKIAAYHFTTLSPNLGVVRTQDNSFVIADLPGLIKGASDGLGLGHKFLKHIERTKIIAHVIDMSSSEGRSPYEDYKVIRKELEKFSPKLLDKTEIIIANKMDLPNSKENLAKFKKQVRKKVYVISALNNQNLGTLVKTLSNLVKNTKEEQLYSQDAQEKHVLYKFKKEKPYTIIKENNHTYIVKGEKVEKIFQTINFNTDEAISRFAKKLRNMGIDEELEKQGIKEGDIIKIMEHEFEYTK